MTPALVVRAAAAADIEDAHAWYERARPGLGEEFLAAVTAVLDRIGDNPALYQVVHRDTRRALLPRFPCAFYRAEPDRILVIACFHEAGEQHKHDGEAYAARYGQVVAHTHEICQAGESQRWKSGVVVGKRKLKRPEKRINAGEQTQPQGWK